MGMTHLQSLNGMKVTLTGVGTRRCGKGTPPVFLTRNGRGRVFTGTLEGEEPGSRITVGTGPVKEKDETVIRPPKRDTRPFVTDDGTPEGHPSRPLVPTFQSGSETRGPGTGSGWYSCT